jgi:hypothetical protein
MGLAASQARFLTLTARKSNIEFQGQQINQQRTVLANKSADVVNKMLALSPPTPPASTSNTYYKVAQNFTNKGDGTNVAGSVNGQTEKIKGFRLVAADKSDVTAATTDFMYEIEYTYMQAGQEMTGKMYTTAVTGVAAGDTSAAQIALRPNFLTDDATGDIVQKMTINNAISFTGGTGTSTYDTSELIYGTSFDDQAYNESMNQYDFNKYTYEKAIADINAETSGIQSKDKSLELKLKQLDSEHGAISTELEAVKNVITKNIEATFKTFG